MKRLKVIQIGIMHDHATATLDAMKMHSDEFELLAICPEGGSPLEYEDFDGKLADVKNTYSDIPFMTPEEGLKLPGLDGVIIEARERDLTYYTVMALNAGFPVHMDKPGGENTEEFNAMVDLAEKKGLVFSLGYMYRQNPAVVKAKQLIKEGAIGEILNIEAHMDCGHPVVKRKWLGNYKGGMMFFLGCHLIDLIVGFQGEPIEVIAKNTSTNIDGVTSEDYGFALLRYEHGWSFAKTSANEPGGFYRRQLVIIGTKGQIEIKPLEENTFGPGGELTCDMRLVDAKNLEDGGWNAKGVTTKFGPHERYYPMLHDFATYVNGEKKNPYTYDYEKLVYKVLSAACGK